MGGFRDLFALVYHWWSSPAAGAVVSGVPCLHGATVYSPGLQAGKVFSPGARDGIVYSPGLKAGQAGCADE